MITINFTDTFTPIEADPDLSYMTFYSQNNRNEDVLIKVEIESHPDPFLPNVYNLAFGPLAPDGRIDDKARIQHSNSDKVFSTVLLLGLTFLQKNPKLSIGIDGSDNTRAYLYHRMFQTNREHLDKYLSSIGVDWYVRVYRDWSYEMDSNGHAVAKPIIQSFDYKRNRHDLYRYYMFRLK